MINLLVWYKLITATAKRLRSLDLLKVDVRANENLKSLINERLRNHNDQIILFCSRCHSFVTEVWQVTVAYLHK